MKVFINILALFVFSMLLSCGGGGGGGTDGGGIGGTGQVTGTITGFGSVIVNGVKFSTSGATISKEGTNTTESALQVGMVVTISGTVDANGTTGTATGITYEDLVEGPVDSITISSNTMVVMGQNVIVGDTTAFDGVNFDQVAIGNILEVSGFKDSTGAIRASRIELKSASFTQSVTQLEVTGNITNLNTSLKTFKIGSLTIDYNTALLSNITTLTDGLLVESKSTQNVSGGILTATKVEGKSSVSGIQALSATAGNWLEIEGFVTSLTTTSNFIVNGQQIITDAQTQFENGTASDIALNTKLEAEGTTDSNGVLVAKNISIRRPLNIKIDAEAEVIDTINSTVKALGITVTINNLTQIQDTSSASLRPFSLSSIAVNDRLKIRAFKDSNGKVIAALLERENANAKVILQGQVDSITSPNLVILGVTIQTDGLTTFQNLSDNAINASAFFSSVQAGRLVKVKGTKSGGVIVAEKVEIED